MTSAWLKNAAGVCLAEVMIALTAGAVVLSATIQSLHHFQGRLSKQHETVAQTQDLRIGLKILEDELRLAGTGSAVSEAPVLTADRQRIEFRANLGGLVTALAESVSSTQQELPVLNGAAWPKGKRVIVCSKDRCAEGRLARDGLKQTLALTGPLGQDVPAGSTVSLSNDVSYSLGADRSGQVSLMRQVDGGTNPLIGNVRRFELSYFNSEGMPIAAPALVARIRVELAVGDGKPALAKEIGLRRK